MAEQRERRNTMPPGVLELVNDHTRRLNGVEDRERELVKTVGDLKLSVDRCERPLKNISKAIWLVASALIGLICVAIFKMFSFHVPDGPPPPNHAELYAPQRADPPQGQHAP